MRFMYMINTKVESYLNYLDMVNGGKYYLLEIKSPETKKYMKNDIIYNTKEVQESKYILTLKRTTSLEYPGKYGLTFLYFNTLKDFYTYVDTFRKKYEKLKEDKKENESPRIHQRNNNKRK